MAIKSSLPVVAPSATPSLCGPKGLAEWRKRKEEEAAATSADPSQGDDDAAGNPFLGMLSGGALKAGVQAPPMGHTQNRSWTFTSSGNFCLDFFFQILPDTPPERLRQLLEAAWNEDSLLALKLLFQLRGVRGTGKCEREGFYTGALWLADKHPGTLLTNLDDVARFGYYKDLLEIVLRVLEGPEGTALRAQRKATHDAARAAAKARADAKLSAQELKDAGVFSPRWGGGYAVDYDDYDSDYAPRTHSYRQRKSRGSRWNPRKGEAARRAKREGTLRPREERVAAQLEKDKAASAQARAARKEREFAAAERAVRAYAYNGSYRALHDAVADVFARQLARDLESLAAGRARDVSLAAKWAPSLDGSYDRQTLLCETIARRMFPRAEEDGELPDSVYVSRARDRLRKEVLTPLRAALGVPEVYAAAGRWADLDYKRVPAACMRANARFFLKRDKARFKKFLADVSAGKARVARAALPPHEVLRDAVTGFGWGARHVAELQWRGSGARAGAAKPLTSCLAVCDVSGSVRGAAAQAAVALAQFVSELAEGPWKGQVITFGTLPQMHALKGKTVKERHAFVGDAAAGAGGGAGFQKVFDNILALARAAKLPPDAMVRRLYVFSAMEFDAASAQSCQTDYMEIERKFAAGGYGAPPEIVFWKLCNGASTPVTAGQKGVALVSGYSKNLLKLFVGDSRGLDPVSVMNRAVAGREYGKLAVVD